MVISPTMLDTALATADPKELGTAPPFSDLFPISPAILGQIRESMVVDGFDQSKPINVWRSKNLVIDGHTRRQAAIEEGVEVTVYFHDFSDEEAALEYAIASQKVRRNLTDQDIIRCIKALDRTRTKGGDRKSPEAKSITSGEVIDRKSSESTASLIGTSSTKVEKVRTIEKHGTPEIKTAVEGGEMSINAAYRETQERRNRPKPKRPASSGPDPEILKAMERDRESHRQSNPLPIRPDPVEPKVDLSPPNFKGTVRDQLANKQAIDRDLKLHAALRGTLDRLKQEVDSLVGPCSAAWMGPLHQAIYNLVHVATPVNWPVCQKCQGQGMVDGKGTCSKCKSAGYYIPDL